MIVPSRLALTEASGREVVERILEPREPTPALRALMAGADGEDGVG